MNRYYLVVIILIAMSCTSQSQKNMTESAEHHGKANKLITSTSPYLLQHAYNPVDWYPWGAEALQKAKEEDKPIIVSIGYSSCHWCHVMERESFENDSIAQIMNDNFITIKVDREERPDVDQIYMDAVQAMGLNGGWPLNVFLTPDQKPFYGGTYFPPQQWVKLLNSVSTAFHNERQEIEKSANELTDILSTSEVIKYKLKDANEGFDIDKLTPMYESLAANFDSEMGGFDRAPKFPMPSNWKFLLRYHYFQNDQKALDHVITTLDEIAKGGIYDQAAGGFSRYSTDAKWLVPHFEKMLYDNGQLMSLYSEAYTVTEKELYKQIVYQTTDWLEREMSNGEGGFYSALDADSEGEEGKFYVWTKDEVTKLMGQDANLIINYYNITDAGNWEEHKNILHKKVSDEKFAKDNNIALTDLRTKVEKANRLFLKERESRVRPGLDDKVLSGWNGLMLKGLTDAYQAFNDDRFLTIAINNASFLKENMLNGNKLYRSYKEGTASFDAYLEDYAAVIEGMQALYQVTFDEKWLTIAKELTDYTIDNFYDPQEQLFFFTDNSSERLIARKKEFFDNVIPSSNSIMAHNLYKLGIIYDSEDYQKKAKAMMGKVQSFMLEEPGYMSNWAMLYSYMSKPTAEIAIVGEKASEFRNQFAKEFHPNKVVMGAANKSDLPLMEGKYAISDNTTIYVCYNKTCKLPVNSVSKAYQQLEH